MDVPALLDDLDPDQRLAVTTESAMVAVIAGAGSGKTRVLTRRVAHRIATGAADPRHTLVLTFTRDAAGELRRRLPRLGLRERVDAGTFHSILLGILRQHWADRGRSSPTVAADRRRLVAEAAGRSGLDEVVAEIDWAAARGISPEEYVHRAGTAGRRPTVGRQRVAEAYDAYRALKRRRGVIDLDDVLSMSVDALERDREFADVVRWRYRHLFVDEAQDLNPLQHRVVDLLRQGHDDLCLVGDPAQAVYGFNGADPTLLLDVADRFPGIEIVRLRTNHRCTPQVVAAGVHVLTAGDLTATAIRSSRADGADLERLTFDDEEAEASGVSRLVARIDPGLLRRGEVAVLARTNAQLSAVHRALASLGVDVRRRIDGSGSPYRDAIQAAVRQGSAAKLRAWAHDLLDELGEADRRVALSEESVEVASAILEFLREQPFGDGVALRSWIASTDPFGAADTGGVDLATFHAAKGREWHTVVVTGVETGLVPHRSATTNAARDEEARLLYVALTRARDRLVVTNAARRGGYRRRPSPLIAAYEPAVVDAVPPPVELVASTRSEATTRTHRALVEWRESTARAVGILPEQLCADATLRAIDESRPGSPDDLAAIAGVGVLTARRWYPALAPLFVGDTVPADMPDDEPDDEPDARSGQTGAQSASSTTTGA